jgi:hypothetical protein
MRAAATLPHPDRLTVCHRVLAAPPADVALAVRHLVGLIAGTEGDELTTLEAIGRAAARLSAECRERPADEDGPIAAMGTWSLENGMLPNVVLGES